jgi:TonB family protein
MTAMTNFIAYLVQSAALLAVLYSVYWLFLRKDTFFQLNRFYLVSSVVLSLVIPLLDIRIIARGAVSPVIIMLDPVIISPEKIEKVASENLSWFEIGGIVYLTGVCIFSLRLVMQFIQLAFIIRRNKITRNAGSNIVFVDRGYSPFSFFNFIFIRKEYYFDDKLTPVLAHEKIHIQQYHTLDLLLVEMALILQWFNPFAWFVGRSMKTIHEFLADEGVLKKGFIRSDYQSLILNEAMGQQVNNLTNNFNVSLLKKRIIMMTKERSSSWTSLKVIAAIPAFFAVLILFTAGTVNNIAAQTSQQQVKPTEDQKVVTQEKPKKEDPVFTVVENPPSYPGGQDAMSKYLVENIKYPEEARTKGIQGTVFVTFVIEKDGTVSTVKILRGIGSGCDEEAQRVVSGMPKWIPGKQKGDPVRVQFNLPINFKLDEKGVKNEGEKK